MEKEKAEAYARQAEETWGDTPEYAEFTQKDSQRSDTQREVLAIQMMALFARFGAIQDKSPASEEAQRLVSELKAFITENYYQCTDEILASLGELYGSGGEFTSNINQAAGEGAAEFAARAIRCYGNQKK